MLLIVSITYQRSNASYCSATGTTVHVPSKAPLKNSEQENFKTHLHLLLDGSSHLKTGCNNLGSPASETCQGYEPGASSCYMEWSSPVAEEVVPQLVLRFRCPGHAGLMSFLHRFLESWELRSPKNRYQQTWPIMVTQPISFIIFNQLYLIISLS